MADYCYTLVSCNPALYADIPDQCTTSTHPYEGFVVYIDGQPSIETYFLQFNGIDTCVCAATIPALVLTDFNVCDVTYYVYELTNCFTSETRLARFNITQYDIWSLNTINNLQPYDYLTNTLGGTTGVVSAFISIAVDNASELAYLMTVGGLMHGIDLNNLGAGTTFIANVPTVGTIVDLAHRDLDGFLYGITNITNTLYKVSKAGGLTNLGNIVFTPSIGASGGGITFNDVGEMYVVAVSALYKVDMGLLTATKLNTAAISTSGVITGATWVRNLLFTITDLNGATYDYDLNTETLTLLNTFGGNSTGTGEQTDRPLLGNVYKLVGECGCWSVSDLSPTYDYTDTIEIAYEDCATCLTAQQAVVCPQGERTLSYANKIKIPKVPVVNKGFKECCFSLDVFAETSGTDDYKNDYTGFYDQKQLPSDTAVYRLVDSAGTPYAITDDTYGIYTDFGGHPSSLNLKTFILEWQKVLNVLGAGSYFFEKTVTVAGIATIVASNTYNLSEFSDLKADKTVRLDCIQDGNLIHLGVNFKGTGFKHSLRVRGFFGQRQTSYEQDNIVFSTYKAVQVSMTLKNEYLYQTETLPSCMTVELFEFLLLGNELFANDYNLNNHEYTFEKLPVELATSEDTSYSAFSRKAIVSLKFTDRFKDKKKINC